MKLLIFTLLALLASCSSEYTKTVHVYEKEFFSKEYIKSKSANEILKEIPLAISVPFTQDIHLVWGEHENGVIKAYAVPSYIYEEIKENDILLITWKSSLGGNNFSYRIGGADD